MSPSKLPKRVFVSSVVEDFREFREAARQAIHEQGGHAILVNEDLPSLESSPRNACLDLVESADIFALIINTRGGWTAPSGKLVIEEEYEKALASKLPIVVFIRDGKRDREAERFAQRVSEYTRGHFRTSFKTPEELRNSVKRSLEQVLAPEQLSRFGDRSVCLRGVWALPPLPRRIRDDESWCRLHRPLC